MVRFIRRCAPRRRLLRVGRNFLFCNTLQTPLSAKVLSVCVNPLRVK